MIVRQFLQWIRHAPPGERAEATSALARAYLYSDLSPDDLAAAEGAMIMLLDDPSPLVRRALAEVFASSQKAPRGGGACAGRRSAGDRGAAAVALAAAARRRSGRSDRHRPSGSANRNCRARAAAALAGRGHRRSRLRAGLSGALGKFRRRYRAVLDRPHGGTVRPSGGDPRDFAGARRSADGDPPGAAQQAVADAGRLRRRTAMDGSRTCRIRGARGLREGHRRARRRDALRGGRPRWCGICAKAGSSPPA